MPFGIGGAERTRAQKISFNTTLFAIIVAALLAAIAPNTANAENPTENPWDETTQSTAGQLRHGTLHLADGGNLSGQIERLAESRQYRVFLTPTQSILIEQDDVLHLEWKADIVTGAPIKLAKRHRKSAVTALLLGIIPGAGHFYSGEVLGGSLLLASGLGCTAIMVATADGFGIGVTIGAVGLLITEVVSIISAPFAAKAYNEKYNLTLHAQYVTDESTTVALRPQGSQQQMAFHVNVVQGRF
jgi:hypothetical protein